MHRTPRLAVLIAIAAALSTFWGQPARAAWTHDGIRLSPKFIRAGDAQRLGSDGAGGIYVTWVPGDNGAITTWTYWQVWALRRLADGSIAPSWPDTGLMIADVYPSSAWYVESIDDVIPDGLGGAFVRFSPYISHANRGGIAHVNVSGADFNGWPADLASASGPSVVVDGDGGLLYSYQYAQSFGPPPSVVATHLRPNGSTGATQTTPTSTSLVAIDTDQSGGAFQCWSCAVKMLDSTLTEYGEAGPWPGCTYKITLISDGEHGAYVVWMSGTTILASRIDHDGNVVAGWNPNGVVVGEGDANTVLRLTRDGSALFVDWIAQAGNRVQRLTAAGVVAPGWAAGGAPIGPTPNPNLFLCSRIVPDGSGGLYVGWSQTEVSQSNVYAQHLTASGSPAPGWVADGDPICTAPGYQTNVSAATDGAGGVFFGWSDSRGGMWGQHLLAGDVIPLAAPLPHPGVALAVTPRTNPSSAGIVCSFSLPSTEPAQLDVFDVTGRLVAQRRIDAATPRSNVVAVDRDAAKPGVYLVRLTQGARSVFSRAVVLR